MPWLLCASTVSSTCTWGSWSGCTTRGEGLKKFDGAFAGDLDKVFQSDQVTIYRVVDGGS